MIPRLEIPTGPDDALLQLGGSSVVRRLNLVW